jgi:hypothetical protein
MSIVTEVVVLSMINRNETACSVAAKFDLHSVSLNNVPRLSRATVRKGTNIVYTFLARFDADIPTEFATAAFEILTRKRVDGLLIQGSIARKEMLDLAIKYRL